MLINCQLKGSTFCEGQDYLRNVVSNGRAIHPSDLYLVREPENAYDKYCVQVWCKNQSSNTNVRLGNINRENSMFVSSYMDTGGTVNVASLKLYGSLEKGQNVGMYFTLNALF
jgi:HIRAN domain.